MPVEKNNNENKIDAYEIEGFSAAYAYANLVPFLSGVIPNSEMATFMGQYQKNRSDNEPSDEEYQEQTSRIRYYYDGNIYLLDSDGYSRGMLNQKGIGIVNAELVRLSKSLEKQADSRSDERTKQYYMDMSFLANPNNGSYTQMVYTSPYMLGLMSQGISLITPRGFSSTEMKANLGVPVYEAIFDFNHAIINEVRTQYLGQSLEKQGWNTEREQQYLLELHKSHEEILEKYENLRKLYDDPQNNTKHYMGNSLGDIVGTNGTTRYVNHYMGFIRGETKAIENGWGKDELFILGMLGGIEEEIRVYENLSGPKEIKEALPAFKSQFLKLKQECFYTSVNSAAEKLEMANKVLGFISEHSDAVSKKFIPQNLKAKFVEDYNTVVWNAAVEVTDLRPVFLRFIPNGGTGSYESEDGKALNEINHGILDDNSAEKTLEKVTGAEDYLSRLEAEGLKNKNLSRFISEYVDIEAKSWNMVGSGVEAFTERALESKEIKTLQKEIAKAYFQLTIECALEVEMTIRDIQEGRMKIDDKFARFKNDYAFCKEYAKHYLLNSNLNKKRRAAENLLKDYTAKCKNVDELQKYKVEFIKNSSVATGEFETRNFLKGLFKNKEDFTNGNKTYITAFAEDIKDVDVTSESFAKSVREEQNALTKYKNEFNNAKDTAAAHFATIRELAAHKKTAVWFEKKRDYRDAANPDRAIDPKKANSQAFMNMVNAMERVAALTLDSTPRQIYEAYRNLKIMSKAYADKIDAQTFAAFSTNGRERRELADTLQNFAVYQLNAIGYVNGKMSPEISVNKQQENLNAIKKIAKEDLKEKVKAELAAEEESAKKHFDIDFDNSDFKRVKKIVVTGIAEMIAIHTLKTEATADNGTIILPSEVGHERIREDATDLIVTNQAFKKMLKSMKNMEDCKKLADVGKKGPNAIFEHLATYANKGAVHAPQEHNNQIIQEGPKLGGM